MTGLSSITVSTDLKTASCEAPMTCATSSGAGSRASTALGGSGATGDGGGVDVVGAGGGAADLACSSDRCPRVIALTAAPASTTTVATVAQISLRRRGFTRAGKG